MKSDVTVIRGQVSWSRDEPVEKAANDLIFFSQVFKLNKMTKFCYLLVKRGIKIPTVPQFLILT